MTHTPEFRVSFPNVFQPKRNELSGKDEYSLVALFPKDADLSKLKSAMAEACVKKWGPDKAKWPKNIRSPLRDQGDRAKEKDGRTTLPQGHEEGAIFLNLKSDRKPGLVDKDVQPIIDQSEFYGGCYAIATVRAYAYSVKGNSGVAFGLGNIQKTRDGEAFGVGRTTPEDDFKPIAQDANEMSADDLFG